MPSPQGHRKTRRKPERRALGCLCQICVLCGKEIRLTSAAEAAFFGGLFGPAEAGPFQISHHDQLFVSRHDRLISYITNLVLSLQTGASLT
jgi:hypothetical protein